MTQKRKQTVQSDIYTEIDNWLKTIPIVTESLPYTPNVNVETEIIDLSVIKNTSHDIHDRNAHIDFEDFEQTGNSSNTETSRVSSTNWSFYAKPFFRIFNKSILMVTLAPTKMNLPIFTMSMHL